MRRNVGAEKNTATGGTRDRELVDLRVILPPGSVQEAVEERPPVEPAADALSVTVDGVEVRVPPGWTIFQAAEAAGYTPPHFCYHRDLSVPANCRMCLCEVEGQGKLQTSCSISVADGMVVKFDTPRVKEAVEGVLEFEFKNHPLDCPVCDQVGECHLQRYYLEVGKYEPLPMERIRKRKVVDLGPITMDAERCVLCSRCVRFGEEITGSADFVIANRSDHSEIKTFDDRPIETDYALNYTDICPVGALTSNDFRFRKRVYYLHTAKSICPGCSTGCNVYAEQSEDVLYRYRPRYNDDVNDSWMCDPGRISSNELADTSDRIVAPMARQNGALVEIDWAAATEKAADAIKRTGGEVAVIAHPELSNEDLHQLRTLVSHAGGRVDFRVADSWQRVDELVDDVLIRRDPYPNTRGAIEALGLTESAESEVSRILADVAAGETRGLVVCGWDLESLGERGREAMKGADWVWFVGSRRSDLLDHADLVLPTAVHVEREGTFTNYAGRVQRFWQSVSLYAESRPGWRVFGDIDAVLSEQAAPRTASEAFDRLAADVASFTGLSYATIGDQGSWLRGWEVEAMPPVGTHAAPGFRRPSPE